MNKDEKPDIKQRLQSALAKRSGLRKYLWIAPFLLMILLYGYVLIKINGFESAAPSASAIASKLKTSASPAINQTVVNELNQLQNNSVSVQALFNQARSNPFQ